MPGLMVCGTSSDAGKSTVVTGLCRLLARQGVKVVPFKAQNMALNSYVTPSGHEIGRAQGVQAIAARATPEVAMNPILLKPTGERTSQVVVMGRPWAHLDAAGYQEAKPRLFPVVIEALEDLRRRFDVVICEGAGSPTEINLLDHDLVNLRVAQAAGFPVLVVGDIDRGGVFAALYGTVALLPDDLQALVKGFIINKLRGDPDLLGDGPAELERRTGVPTVGVLPYLRDVALDAEDSLALDGRRPGPVPPVAAGGPGAERDPLEVAVIRFPRISNFTDLDALAIEPGVTVRLIDTRGALGDPDLIILPGTKSTVADLAWLRGRGFPDAIDEARRQRQATVLGICGGYQMLGQQIDDPIEAARAEAVAGLGWLSVVTTFEATKVTRQRRGRLAANRGGVGAGDRRLAANRGGVGAGDRRLAANRGGVGAGDRRLAADRGGRSAGHPSGAAAGIRVSGYQIHHGRTTVLAGAEPWLWLDDAYGCGYDGAVSAGGAVLGTSLHGLFEEDGFRTQFLAEVAHRRAKRWHDAGVSFAAARETQIDRLADLLDAHLDLAAIKAMIT